MMSSSYLALVHGKKRSRNKKDLGTELLEGGDSVKA